VTTWLVGKGEVYTKEVEKRVIFVAHQYVASSYPIQTNPQMRAGSNDVTKVTLSIFLVNLTVLVSNQ